MRTGWLLKRFKKEVAVCVRKDFHLSGAFEGFLSALLGVLSRRVPDSFRKESGVRREEGQRHKKTHPWSHWTRGPSSQRS